MEQRHGAAAALSAPAERRGAGEETVTHTQASSHQLRGFTCAFTRRNCTHDVLFSPQYMRTNRLKGTKIMRCFPHCCPQHVSRSYCGASLYLQVDLDEYTSVVTHDNEIGDDKLQVFGRFRVQEARGLAVGEQISLDAVTSSLNSESNPTGEWVAARMIASAGHNAWLFEINPSAKWFYDWEVGAVRDRRAMPHVFEAYVFVPREGRQADRTQTPHVQMTSAVVPLSSTSMVSSAHRNHLYESGETSEVVALVASSPFTLSSFRRASSSRGRSHHATTGHSSGEERTIVANEHPRRDQYVLPFEGDTEALGGDDGGSIADADTERGEDTYDEETGNLALSELVRGSDADLGPKTIHSQDGHDFDMDADERASDAITPQPHVASAARNTMLVNWLLLHIPLRAAQPFTKMIDQYLNAALWEQLRSSFVGDTSPPSARPSLRPDSLKLSTFVSRLLGSLAAPESTGDNNAASDNDHLHEPTADANELLIELSVKLMLWMFFDRDNNAQMEAFLQRSAKVLLDKVALYKSYEAWTEWLQERIDEYLFTQGWSLTRLVVEIEDILNAGETSVRSNGSAVFPGKNWNNLDDAYFVADSHVAAGHEVFVAQAREVYVSALSISPLVQCAQTRIHPHQSRAVQAASGSSSFETGNRLSQLTGLWLCDLNAASCRDIASESAQTAREAPIGIMSLLWMWKQLGCLYMAFSTENGVPALLIGSAFNPSLSSSTVVTEDRVTRIVLDQQHHWFRCFPGGESSIGTRISGQSFGDYVASVSGGAGDLSVEIKCYSWASTGSH